MKRSTRGFTLLELLVAIAIFAVLAVMAYGGLNSVIRQREQNDTAMLRLKQLQQAMAIMTRDFAQMAPRPVRDQLGGVHCALSAGPNNVPPIEFTRGGWTNPLGVIRSTQQRVAYALEDGTLVRYTWPELD
ncbi:MAG TPA: type II secretion system minor pseudopilin GspJ, partial [Gammaproteobacteria bacterium]|nr:type II secretion system minor pseudopilin GspJ [Gammaproteobacteria bacterium]